ncbi:UPF0389 protein CG9231 [Anthonomus grandis grandis]|uniref:UPF0389 protein CG9231 n=1 Tax=Anthonomus grandis grandis TaxID=2921223 RepID=UPI002165360F|nr:UPF0389 protein CG9231 [Anthonomus grandis grandis]
MIFQTLQKITNLPRYYCEQKHLPTTHKVSVLDRRFLVWMGKYKTVDEVPEYVTRAVIDKTRNRIRIKVANYMIAATLGGCCLMMYLGKQDAKEGKSLQKQNLEWHRKINEDSKKESSVASDVK